jgi:N-acylneuraminate cytidylyltransferase
MDVADRPLVSYPVKAAEKAESITKTYTSTNGDEIADVAREWGSEIIWRPEELWGDGGHGDVIKHATETVDEEADNLENVVLLLGNTTMIDPDLIDQAVGLLEERPEVDSTMTVWEAADDHPVRAMMVNNEGYLSAYDEASEVAETDRKSYNPAFYYDQGIWAFRKETVEKKSGPGPWWWMGAKCIPIVRTWTTGRDVHSYFDAHIHSFYERNREDLREFEERVVWDEYKGDE